MLPSFLNSPIAPYFSCSNALSVEECSQPLIICPLLISPQPFPTLCTSHNEPNMLPKGRKCFSLVQAFLHAIHFIWDYFLCPSLFTELLPYCCSLSTTSTGSPLRSPCFCLQHSYALVMHSHDFSLREVLSISHCALWWVWQKTARYFPYIFLLPWYKGRLHFLASFAMKLNPYHYVLSVKGIGHW